MSWKFQRKDFITIYLREKSDVVSCSETCLSWNHHTNFGGSV